MELNKDRYIKVQDHEGLVKDSVGNAVLNSDTDAFDRFKAKRRKEKETEERLNNMEQQMTSIHDMLTLLLEKK